MSCDHQPWLTEFWLLLAVISNANGSVLFMTRFLDYPVSWFAAVVFIIAYRLFFSVKTAMPIALDLCVSLLCQSLVTAVEDNGWECAVSAAFLLNLSVFHGGYFSTYLHQEYIRLKQMHPKRKPAINNLIHPLSVELLFRAMIVVHIFQGFFFVFTWFFPFGDRFYRFYQIFIGYFMVDESVTFLNCYREIVAATEAAANQKQKRPCFENLDDR